MAPKRLRGVVAGLLVLAGAAATGPAAETEPATLTESAPVACFPLDPGALARAPTAVRLEIAAVTNPALKGLNFDAYLIRGGKTWDVGVFSLYPPDHPGVFTLRMDVPLKAAENRSGSAVGDIISICIALKAQNKVNPNGGTSAPVSVRLLPPILE
jgi:hypothetical protein